MKANQAFRNADEAVSPVIGVILMVAITVVLAAVVFVLVTKLSGNQQNASESAAVSMSSPSAKTIYITMVSGGQNSPYTVQTAASTTSDVTVTVNSNNCGVGKNAASKAILQDSNGDGLWGAGETLTVTNTDCSAAGTITSGTTYLVSVTVHGTVLQDNTKVVAS